MRSYVYEKTRTTFGEAYQWVEARRYSPEMVVQGEALLEAVVAYIKHQYPDAPEPTEDEITSSLSNALELSTKTVGVVEIATRTCLVKEPPVNLGEEQKPYGWSNISLEDIEKEIPNYAETTLAVVYERNEELKERQWFGNPGQHGSGSVHPPAVLWDIVQTAKTGGFEEAQPVTRYDLMLFCEEVFPLISAPSYQFAAVDLRRLLLAPPEAHPLPVAEKVGENFILDVLEREAFIRWFSQLWLDEEVREACQISLADESWMDVVLKTLIGSVKEPGAFDGDCAPMKDWEAVQILRKVMDERDPERPSGGCGIM